MANEKVKDQETGEFTEPTVDESSTEGDVKTQEKEKLFSEEQMAEINKMIQSERDKSVAKVKADKDKEVSKYQQEIADLKKAQMTEDERRQAEMDELSQKERAIQEKERMLTVVDKLVDVGLPRSFAKRINGTDESEIDSDITELSGYIDDEVQRRLEDEVKKRFAGGEPKGGQPANRQRMSLADFNKLPPKKQQEFMSGGGILE